MKHVLHFNNTLDDVVVVCRPISFIYNSGKVIKIIRIFIENIEAV